MSQLKYLILGIYFGIVLIKGEVVSWYRIQEMFHFQSFHMFGIIGSAVIVGLVSVMLLKKTGLKSIDGKEIVPEKKPLKPYANLIGGILFGLGWAITGACPGPVYSLIAAGYGSMAIVLVAAFAGVFAYAGLKSRLPH